MNQMTSAMMELAGMDELSKLDSPLHRRHPLVKLILTIVYIFTVVSFPKESIAAMVPMFLYPALLFALSGIAVRTCFYKLRFILPIVCAVGIWNPFFDRTVVLRLGSVPVTGGMISFAVLLLKGILSLMASFLLIASTGIEQICFALSLVKVPDLLVTQILITYRYISLLLGEAGNMMNAYSLRAPGQKGLHFSVWGSFVGQLLLRSMDRARSLYQSMLLRGFSGSFYYAGKKSLKAADLVWLIAGITLIVLFRIVNVSVWIGNLFVR